MRAIGDILEVSMISRDNVDLLLSECQVEKEIAEQTLKELRLKHDCSYASYAKMLMMSECKKQIAHYSTIIELCEFFNDIQNRE